MSSDSAVTTSVPARLVAFIERRFVWLVIALLACLPVGYWAAGQLKPFEPKAHEQEQRKAEIDRKFAEGVKSLRAREYESALSAFHRVLVLAPEMPEAHVNTGFALLGMKSHAMAADFFETAVRLRPEQVNAYYGLALARKETGRSEEAMQAIGVYLHLAAQNDPFRPRAEALLKELHGSGTGVSPGSGGMK